MSNESFEDESTLNFISLSSGNLMYRVTKQSLIVWVLKRINLEIWKSGHIFRMSWVLEKILYKYEKTSVNFIYL